MVLPPIVTGIPVDASSILRVGTTLTPVAEATSTQLGKLNFDATSASATLALDAPATEPADATDGFLSRPELLAPFRHIARLPTKDVRVHFLRALVSWMPVGEASTNHPQQLSSGQSPPAEGEAAPSAAARSEEDGTMGPSNSTVRFERACGAGGLLHHLCTATRVLHTVSLLYDDIEDDSDTRRGEPCAHVKYGVAWTLNAASAATFAALGELAHCAADAAAALLATPSPPSLLWASTLQNQQLPGLASQPHGLQPSDDGHDGNDELRAFWTDLLTGRLTRACTAAMRRLHSGQGKDIWHRDTGACPTMAEYDTLCVEKTGGLFRLIADWVAVLHHPFAQAAAAAAAATSPPPLRPPISAAMLQRILALCDRFGLCFQILDDYLNLCDDGAAVLKGYCEDLQEGKFSFLVVHAVWTLRSQQQQQQSPAEGSVAGGNDDGGAEGLIARLRRRPRSRSDKDDILRILHACGSFDAAVAAIKTHCGALTAEVRAIDDALHFTTAAVGATRETAAHAQGNASVGVDDQSGGAAAAVAALIGLVDAMRARAITAHPCGRG